MIGGYVIYVNGAYAGNDEIGKLMHDFRCSDPKDMHYEEIAKVAQYYKETKKGQEIMCRAMEERIKEEIDARNIEQIRKMLADNIDVEHMANYLSMPVYEVEEIVLKINEGSI